jgi:hypothetical protein
MNSRLRPGLVASGAVLLVSGFLTGVLFVSASLAATIDDPVADTVNDTSREPLPEARADIVSASADYGPSGISLTVRPRQPGDPLRDSNWTSEYSFIHWELDVTGDTRSDYIVQYEVYDGDHYGFVDRYGAPEDADPLCDLSAATWSPVNGFSVRFEPNCLGNPASFSYRVAIYYDTRAGDDDAPAASDRVPDRGFAGPVAMGAAATATPTAPAPLVALPKTPAVTSPAPSAAPVPAAPRPQAVQAAPPAPAARPVPAATPAARLAPASAPRPGPAASAPAPRSAFRPAPAGPSRPMPGAASAPAVKPAVTDPASSAPELARTGPSRTVALAGMALALVLAGLGLVMLARGFAPVLVPVRVPEDGRPVAG